MITFRRPSVATLEAFLAEQSPLDFTYKAIGATAEVPPVGFQVDHRRIKLGEGEAVYRRAKVGLERWDQFRLGWVESWPTDIHIQPGAVVAVFATQMGVWWHNACRIVYVVDELGPLTRFGFAYGTLPAHAESGEERFLLEWDRSTNAVYYDVLAFSRPRHLLTRLGYPLIRRLQKRFSRDSAAAMLRRVKDERD